MIYVNEEKLNDYEREHERISYKTLLKALGIYDNLLLCNNIVNYNLELINGSDYDEESGEYEEIFQFFLFDANEWTIEKIKSCTDLVVYYCNDLELYVLGVDHYGTSWDYVLTDVEYTTNLEKALASN